MVEVGLCQACRHGRRIATDRGSVFWLCGLSRVNSSFPKYPNIPVLQCGGYETLNEDTDADIPDDRH